MFYLGQHEEILGKKDTISSWPYPPKNTVQKFRYDYNLLIHSVAYIITYIINSEDQDDNLGSFCMKKNIKLGNLSPCEGGSKFN